MIIFWEKVLLFSPDWPVIHYWPQTHRDRYACLCLPNAKIKVCANMPDWQHNLIKKILILFYVSVPK